MNVRHVSKDTQYRRMHDLLLLFMFAFAVILLRIGYMQISQNAVLTKEGIDRYTRTLRAEQERGKIYDRHDQELALSLKMDNIVVNPYRFMQRLEEQCHDNAPVGREELSSIYGLCSWGDRLFYDKNHEFKSEDTRRRKAVQEQFCDLTRLPDYPYSHPEMNQCIADMLTPLAAATSEQLDRIYRILSDDEAKDEQGEMRPVRFRYLRKEAQPWNSLNIKDLRMGDLAYIQQEYKRHYLMGHEMSQIIGYTSYDGVGVEGLEYQYETMLKPQIGESRVTQDASRKVMHLIETVPAAPGASLKLTVDANLQKILYRHLLQAQNLYRANMTAAVLMDVRSGEILAMLSVPTGNANNTAERQAFLIQNHTVADSYEPGSIIKPFAVAAAMQAGLITPNTRFDVGMGRTSINGNLVKDSRHYSKPTVLNVSEIIRYSSNVGMAKIAEITPYEVYWNMLRSLGFGEVSDLNFQHEQAGRINTFGGHKRPFEFATQMYGYGVMATLVQLTHAYATLANDGVKMSVNVVYRDKTHEQGEVVIDPKVARAIQKMLYQAVEQDGTGRRARSTQYSMAGKTGTARKAIFKKGYVDEYRAFFAGFAPARDPHLAMVVLIDEPHAGNDDYYGGRIAAPLFTAIMEDALHYLKVPPDKEETHSAERKIQTPWIMTKGGGA